MIICEAPKANITAFENVGGTQDLTTLYTTRYRLASDPDVDGSYIGVSTRAMIGITMYFFDVKSVDPGTYVLHTFLNSEGSGTGVKATIVVECDDEVLT